MLIYILFILFLFVIVASIIAYAKDKISWNNGRCSYCGNKWKFKETVYGNIRVYKCDHCGKQIYISYNVDSEHYKNLKDYER